MHGDETPEAYLNRAQEYADALATIGEPVKDKDLVMLAVLGLREEYNGLKTTITALGSPSMLESRQAQLLKLTTQLSALGFQVSPIAPSDTGANSHVTPNLKAMDNSEAYYGDDALHVGNGKGLPILHIGSSKVYSPQKTISQEDVNQKFLRSLSPEWNTHIIVWRNKPKIDTLSLDDLYNNLKIYEPEVKGTSSTSTNTQNVAFVSSNNTSNTNGAVNTTHGAITASTQAIAVNSTTIDNLSDAVICAFFASQPNCNTPIFDI
ncbi:hypothetical protein Tco_1452546 [Tanacetum coccineum]